MKSKHPNVMICPNKGMLKDGDEHQKNVTKMLRYHTFISFFKSNIKKLLERKHLNLKMIRQI